MIPLPPVVLSQETSPSSHWTLEFEGGLLSTRYNTATIPKNTGTEVDLATLLGRRAQGAWRGTVIYSTANGGDWKFVYAPLRRSGDGQLASPTQFKGHTFTPGSVEGLYQFNGYRLTYRKRWRGPWSLGATLNVRDAEIRLSQAGTTKSEKNVGLVPLLNVHGTGTIRGDWGYEIELDALAGGPGRAIDFSSRLTRSIGKNTQAFLGYRLLEGGADVPRVKNFAWFNFFTAGVSYRFAG